MDVSLLIFWIYSRQTGASNRMLRSIQTMALQQKKSIHFDETTALHVVACTLYHYPGEEKKYCYHGNVYNPTVPQRSLNSSAA